MCFILHEYMLCNELYMFISLQEECVLSDPQGESDADADIEDTDCRFAHVHIHIRYLVFSSSSIVLV